MKILSTLLLFLITLVVITFSSCDGKKSANDKSLSTDSTASKENASYALGMLISEDFKKMGINSEMISTEEFAKGLKEALGGKPKMDIKTAQMTVQKFMQEAQIATAKNNAEKGKNFLEENLKKNPKLKTTASGIQYEIIKEGNGPKPKESDTVETHYHGTLIDGSVFDSSVDRGEPIEFPLNQVISGWTEILQLMPKGSKWKVFIPSALAYGEQGSQGGIGPNETLIFEIELLKINGN
jgi:FKBP-type peptidyl-prolyl cis-trans isomerase FklB